MMEIRVTLIETHTNEETFKIKELPDNWDEMSRWDQYSYIGEHGDYIESYTELFHVEDVLDVKVLPENWDELDKLNKEIESNE